MIEMPWLERRIATSSHAELVEWLRRYEGLAGKLEARASRSDRARMDRDNIRMVVERLKRAAS